MACIVNVVDIVGNGKIVEIVGYLGWQLAARIIPSDMDPSRLQLTVHNVHKIHNIRGSGFRVFLLGILSFWL